MALLPPVRGLIVRIDDRYTGFREEEPKHGRPCVVIDVFGRQMRIVPQSTRGDRGIYVPEDVVEGLEPGWFVPWSRAISIRHAAPNRNVGYLPNLYLEQVIEQWKRRKR